MAKLLHAVRVALNLRVSNCQYQWHHYVEL